CVSGRILSFTPYQTSFKNDKYNNVNSDKGNPGAANYLLPLSNTVKSDKYAQWRRGGYGHPWGNTMLSPPIT
ncbi:hypothetical protein AVEN_143456-1, partial [Araneus ventricosus]